MLPHIDKHDVVSQQPTRGRGQIHRFRGQGRSGIQACAQRIVVAGQFHPSRFRAVDRVGPILARMLHEDHRPWDRAEETADTAVRPRVSPYPLPYAT